MTEPKGDNLSPLSILIDRPKSKMAAHTLTYILYVSISLLLYTSLTCVMCQMKGNSKLLITITLMYKLSPLSILTDRPKSKMAAHTLTYILCVSITLLLYFSLTCVMCLIKGNSKLFITIH